jgi:hypothetical protein
MTGVQSCKIEHSEKKQEKEALLAQKGSFFRSFKVQTLIYIHTHTMKEKKT